MDPTAATHTVRGANSLVITSQQVEELQAEEGRLDSQLTAVRRTLDAIRVLLEEGGEEESRRPLEDLGEPPQDGVEAGMASPAPLAPNPRFSGEPDTLTALIPRAIEAKPGSTPKEIRDWILAHGNPAARKRARTPYFYKAVHRLAKAGSIRKAGMGYQLA